ncbi:MAG: rod shape-determining protein MreC [bacterium]|nr:rod shape-determining protein MreC [bacterium]
MTPRDIKNIEFLIFIVTAGLLVFLSIVGGLRPLTNLVSRVTVPLLSFSTSIFRTTGNYQTLQDENAKLKSQLADADSLKKENENLQKALSLGYEEGRRILPASRIGFYRFFDNEIIIIDRGVEAGVAAGDIVQTADKVYAGKVISSTSGRADVLLVTSRNQVIDVTFTNSNIRARARGINGREFAIDFVPENAEIHKGDLFIVTPKAGNKASNLVLGEIREISSDESHVFKIIRALHLFDSLGDATLFVSPSDKLLPRY